jgi:hypothetical protein
MRNPQSWALMQRVETCRLRAERVESAGADWSEPGRELASDLACQWRQIAEQMYALSEGRELEAIAPLRRNYADLGFWSRGSRSRDLAALLTGF